MLINKKIISVKRLSDGEIFSLEDKILGVLEEITIQYISLHTKADGEKGIYLWELGGGGVFIEKCKEIINILLVSHRETKKSTKNLCNSLIVN